MTLCLKYERYRQNIRIDPILDTVGTENNYTSMIRLLKNNKFVQIFDTKKNLKH